MHNQQISVRGVRYCCVATPDSQPRRVKMSSKKNNNHKANQSNPNKGTSGTNKDYAHVHGNRGAQLNPNRPATKGK